MDRIHSVRRHALTLSLTLRDGREGPQGSGVESSRYRVLLDRELREQELHSNALADMIAMTIDD